MRVESNARLAIVAAVSVVVAFVSFFVWRNAKSIGMLS